MRLRVGVCALGIAAILLASFSLWAQRSGPGGRGMGPGPFGGADSTGESAVEGESTYGF